MSCSFGVISLLVFFGMLSFFSCGMDDGATLLKIKRSFHGNVNNILIDWTDVPSSNYCFWRGITCHNITYHVVALNLSGFGLYGKISSAIGDLKGIALIDLKLNQLSGQIPDEIGNCTQLVNLDLSLNTIHGDIPSSISRLKQLESLILEGNQLSGRIPPSLFQIPNLKFLYLRENNLEGVLPPDMCRLTGLQYFDVFNNSLTGTIPQTIGNCTSFRVLDLSYNQFVGELPFNIGSMQVASLFLQNNKFTGKIPSAIGLMPYLIDLDLSCNHLSGSIPSTFGNLSHTQNLYFQGNKLTGPIPPQLSNISWLQYLDLSDNQLTGYIPPEFEKLTDLLNLNVANNYLEGAIPDNLSSCVNLTRLYVQGNKFNGTIPRAFKNLKNLAYLNMSSNELYGLLPIELTQMANLDTIDMSCNKISGPIPASIGDLEHLIMLNLSHNHLVGHIPEEFGNIRDIVEIDLSSNELSGTIPKEFGLLKVLELLKVENNNLSGGIMPLTSCFSLSVLNLSYNHLSGEIPTINNFSRFLSDSFIGNPGLCGYQLRSQCLSSHSHRAATKSKVAIILGIALGSLVILLMILIAAYSRRNPPPFSDGSQNNPVCNSWELVPLQKNMSVEAYNDIIRLTENLSDNYIIGHGASSTVYRCVLENRMAVAIKKLHSDPQSLEEFESEIKTIGNIKHRNLVNLLGYALSRSSNLLFYKYMEKGSLFDILHGPLRGKLEWDTRLKIAREAAEGLTYLHHGCHPPIIHRKIKSSNILLDNEFVAHLTDFGIAKILSASETHTSTSVKGAFGYIDPEYALTLQLNEKSDIYSFGIVLLELITGKPAVENGSNLHDRVLSHDENNTMMEIIDADIKSVDGDLEDIRKVLRLALQCTKRKPASRPSMQEVTRLLTEDIHSASTRNSVSSSRPSVQEVTRLLTEDMSRYELLYDSFPTDPN